MDKEESNIKPRFLKYKERKYRVVTPLVNQTAQVPAEETLKCKMFKRLSVPLKSEKTEEIYQDYYPESITQPRTVALQPATHKEKRKSGGKQEHTLAYPKARKVSFVSYDKTEPKEDDVIRHITRLREKLGWETDLLPKDLKYHSSKIAVQKITLKEPLKDDGEFVYCIPRYNPEGLYNPYDPQVVKLSGNIEDVELTPVLEWLSERHFYYLLQRFKIFSKFRMNKAFVTWKLNVKRKKVEKSKSFLYRNLFWADEIFQGCLLYIKGLCEDAINLKNNNEHKDNPSAICLIKLDTSRTYSIDEFCEEQLQQTTRALKQLEDVRDKVISEVKSTILKVAEKKEIREYFESKSFEDGTTHFKLPTYRHLLETAFRFLMLIDYILQELIRQLMNIAVTLLLELFNDSATMPLSNGKKNEDLIG
uniref:Dynein axonemal heavy chain 14 n=1 Tax=Sciurus vulgaris TaxID=55149 RepID=A0A8D2CVT5_SCIVU